MGVFDAIWNGEVPSWDDVGETAGTVADVADTAMMITNPAYAVGRGLGEGAAYLHYDLRDQLNHVGDPSAQPTPEDLAGQESQRNPNGWTRVPDWQADLHQDETEGHEGREAKFVHEDGRESVRYVNPDGGLGPEVTRDDIRGTYNYVNPGNWEENGVVEYGARMAGHFMLDVLPWAIGGSVRGPG